MFFTCVLFDRDRRPLTFLGIEGSFFGKTGTPVSEGPTVPSSQMAVRVVGFFLFLFFSFLPLGLCVWCFGGAFFRHCQKVETSRAERKLAKI